MDNIFKVRTLVQRTLMEAEIQGQISDGAWENTRPLDHWRAWCNAMVIVDPIEQGRNFHPMKDNYGLHSLIQYVGDRMLHQARAAFCYPELVTELLDNELTFPDEEWGIRHYIECKPYSTRDEPSPSQTRVRDLFEKYGVTADQWREVIGDDGVYGIRDLRLDLAEIKVAMKTFIL